MKKILLLFVALITLSVAASAQDQERIQVFVDGDWAYAINPYAEHEVTVVQYQGKEGSEATELTIPSYATYNGSRYFVTELGESLFYEFSNEGNDQYTHYWSHETYTKLEKVNIPNTVTLIYDNAFKDCISLTSVNIPNSVTRMTWCAFYGCTGLTSVTIPNSLTEIGYGAFAHCTGLTSVTIPNSVTKISAVAFKGCTGLTSVTIPNSVTIIWVCAFYGCTGLTSVTIPNSVTEIRAEAFSSCNSLQGFVVEDGNSQYTAVDGVLYNSNRTALIAYPGGIEGAFEIPNTVTEIGTGAFRDCTSLTSVAIPNSVTEIGEYAFRVCTSLTSVAIPNSVTKIGGGALRDCTSLTSVTIPNSVTKIDGSTFKGCTSLASVTIPNSVTEIGYAAFGDCTSLTTIYALPATPPSCDKYSFQNVPETTVVYIPKGSFKEYFVAEGWIHFTDFREMGALDITLSESTISIEEGKTATITATVTKDDDVKIESETWSTTNPEVATVDNGVVTAVGEGTATISYTVVDDYGCPHTESCEVTVTEMSGISGIEADDSDAPAEYYNLNGVRVNADNLTPGIYIKRQGSKATKVLVK